MWKKTSICCVVLALFLGCSQTDIYYISGIVQDDAGNTIPGIRICILGTNNITTTDSHGAFMFTYNKGGKIILEVHGEYGPGRQSLELQKEYTTTSITYPVATEIIFLHTNDNHAYIDGFSALSARAKEIRAKHKNVFLFSGGDLFSGDPFVDQYEKKGYPIIDLMNVCGYDVSVIGNHEFDYGQQILNKRMEDAHFPFIAANVKVNQEAHGKLTQPDAYVVFQTENNLKIAVLGLITTNKNGKPSTDAENIIGIDFTDGIEEARNYQYLNDENEVFVVLSHLGYPNDQELARKMNKDKNIVDIIVGGHTHTVIENPKEEYGALIAQAGTKTAYLGQINVMLENNRIVYKNGLLIDLQDSSDIDWEVQAMIDAYKSNKALLEVIGQALCDIEGKEKLAHFVCDVLTLELNLDCAFQQLGGIRIDKLLAGDITIADIYRLDPFEDKVTVFELKPKEIRSLVYRNSYFQVAGITYTIENPEDENSVVLMNEQGVLEENKTYRVGMNDYMANRYDFDHQDIGETLCATIATTLIKYIKRVVFIDAGCT